MNRQTTQFAALAVVAAAFAAPLTAQAEAVWHQGNGNVVQFNPTHGNSNKTRAQVVAEVEKASADGSLRYYQMAVPVPGQNPTGAKTRQQVMDEVINQSPAEKARLKALYGG